MFGVSRQVYYRSIKSGKAHQARAEAAIELVGKARIRMPRLGTRKLYHVLSEELKGISVGRDKLFRILKANHQLIKPHRSYHVTTNSHHHFRKHKNLVEKLPIVRPEQVWVSDITYLGTRDRQAYLALITDAYSKKIVGYSLSAHLDAANCVIALKQAMAGRMYRDAPLIHHSDRGIQYCCSLYQSALKRKGVLCSMTEAYDPYQNAVAERVNGILKQEFMIDRHHVDIKTLSIIVKECIAIYNNERPHYSNFMLTPIQMHQQQSLAIRTYRKEKSPAT